LVFFPSRYQGHIGAYLILAGVDFDGPHLYSIAAHGSTDKIPFAAMGSGMLSAMSMLVSRLIEIKLG
jgi:20S proteasome subunit beta 2